jgi:hypothetical protein
MLCRAVLPLAVLLTASALAGTPPVPDPAPDTALVQPDASDVDLRYQAFVAGAPVGEATVKVALADGVYRVEGDARSNGWLKGFTNWRNQFSARGRLDGLNREPTEFSYTERDSRKHRHVVVRDGTLQVTKNGKQRPSLQSPSGADIISALFVQPHCRGDQVLHTGRHVYRLSRLAHNPDGCRYSVVDDDDDTFEIELVLGRRDGLVVPTKIKVYAWLTGWVELMEK